MNVIQNFLNAAARDPQATALRTPRQRLTYQALRDRAGALAAALAARGLRRGEVVGLSCQPGDFVAMTLAVAWAGGTSMAYSATTGEEASRLGRLSDMRMFVRTAQGPLPPLPPGVRVQATVPELLADNAAAIEVADMPGEAAWRIGFSSGTTGRPKAMTFSHSSGIAKTQALSRLRPLLGRRTLVDVGYTMTFGLTYWLREISRGATAFVGLDRPAILRLLGGKGVDLLVASPGNALRLVNLMRRARVQGAPRVGKLMVGGAPVTPGQLALLRERLCREVWVNYGATEVGLVALRGPEADAAPPSCAGRLVPWVKVEAVDEAGQVLPPGSVGLLRFQSPTMATGYLDDGDAPGAVGRAFDGGWFQSSDTGRVSPEGFVFLASRSEEVLNIGGVKYDPAEAERVIQAFPGVLEAVVVAGERMNGVTVPVACVATEGPHDEAALRRHCQSQLEPHMVPRGFVFMKRLPRNEAGKVQRAQLAAGLKNVKRDAATQARGEGA